MNFEGKPEDQVVKLKLAHIKAC